MKNKFGIIALIGIGLYFLLKGKNSPVSKLYFAKIGARLRKQPNTNSEVLKTYNQPVSLKFIKTQQQTDALWYLVQELWEQGSKGSDGSDISGNVKWTGWLRQDVINIIQK